jgi:hypothetical protein
MQLEFSPVAGNVAFGSASDGWAVRCSTFASLYSDRLGLSFNDMLHGLWGQAFYNSRQKQVSSTGSAGKPTMFEQFLLQPIWDVCVFPRCSFSSALLSAECATRLRYSAVIGNDAEAVAKIVQVFAFCPLNGINLVADNLFPKNIFFLKQIAHVPQRLKLDVAVKDVQHKDRRCAVQSIMSAWVGITSPTSTECQLYLTGF